MSLSQVQIIRSLGDALAWFEKELSWGVEPAQLGHLTGRIGELYAAMITRGQMALATNQHGYDVVSAESERISVKTVTSSTHVSFRKSTFNFVDRVLVLRLNVEDGEASIEELLDCKTDHLREIALESATDFSYRIRASRREPISLDDQSVTAQAAHGSYRILQYESGTIAVEQDGMPVLPVKPVLRSIAASLGVPLLNAAENPRNTRQLGAEIIAVISANQPYNEGFPSG